MALRKVWALPKEYSAPVVSPDGRYISYYTNETGDLGLHDLVSGTDRRLTNKGSWAQSEDYYSSDSAFSPDGKQIVYLWFDSRRQRFEVRLISLVGAGMPQPRRLFGAEDVSYVDNLRWSPDGKSIAAEITRNDRSAEIGLISVQDGSLRVLKAIESPRLTGIFFSPDGRYLAVELRQDNSPQLDIFVLSADGTRDVPAVVHESNDVIMDWSPDGRHLLFASDRTGTVDLWALPFAGGTQQGAPELVKQNIGSTWSLGVSSGALYFWSRASDEDVTLASIDLETGRQVGPTVRPIQNFVGFNRQPDWSRDGRYLTYTSRPRQPGLSRVLAIRSVDTGQVRELQPKLLSINWPRLAPDGRSFIVQGIDSKRQQGVYQIDAQTGDAIPIAIASPNGNITMPQWSPDGKRIYYHKYTQGTDGTDIIERELASGVEREVIRRTGIETWSLSTDGRHLAVSTYDRPTKSSIVLIIPVAGGELRELARLTLGQFWSYLTWTPDGNLLARKVWSENDATGRFGEVELWQIPVSGGPPRKLAIDARNIMEGPVRVHPDGRQIAFVEGTQKSEVWALENFLPALSGKK